MAGGFVVQRSNPRLRALAAALVFLVVLALVFDQMGKKQEAGEELQRWESSLLLADDASVRSTVRSLGEALAADDRAGVPLLALAARAELLAAVLFTGSERQRGQAQELLTLVQERAPEDPQVLLMEAFWAAAEGSPARALEILEHGTLGSAWPDWQAVIRAEAELRSGGKPDLQVLANGTSSPLLRVWALRIAWEFGDLAAVRSQAALLRNVSPDHVHARVFDFLAEARLEPDGAAEQRLLRLLVVPEEWPPVVRAHADIDLSRTLRRVGRTEEADRFLEEMAGRDPESPVLQAELARNQRFIANFGVAFERSDKGLRDRPADPGLLAELAVASWFMDSADKIDSRLKLLPPGLQDSTGQRRAEGMAALLRGEPDLALPALESTRHLGPAGDTELWLSEAYLQAGQADRALTEARRAEAQLSETFGTPSHAVSIAQLYQGLALLALGQEKAGSRRMDTAYIEPFQTPWAAWLYGRFLEGQGKTRSAKDLYLLACHNGQDFALACYSLAEIYESLRVDAVERATQQRSRELYLRIAPGGVHSEAVRAALGAG